MVFLVLKIVEWVRLIHMGYTFTSSQFFQYYFFLTAIHCVHLLIGFVVLGVLMYQLSNEKRRSQLTVETCATYWHIGRLLLGVDLRPALRGEVTVETAFNKRLFVVWLILVAISLVYLWIDHEASHQGIPTASAVVTVGAICLALIKVRIIMREFMEVRGAPRFLRRITDVWVVLMGVAMLGVYIAGRAVV